MSDQPLIKFGEDTGNIPVLNYNVPEPTSYSGNHYISLDLDPKYFVEAVKQKPTEDAGYAIKVKEKAKTVLAEGKPLFLEGAVLNNTNIDFTVLDKINNNNEIKAFTTVYGDTNFKIVNKPENPKPTITLVESYRLTSFLGDYGAGRTIKTFSLLPGEKTKISIKTYKKTEQEFKQSSSILDSFTDTSATEFESTLQSEQSDKKNSTNNFEYHAEVEAQAKWGWGSAKVEGGVKGGTTGAREEFAKNVKNSTEKHASTASAKRDININTSSAVMGTDGEETAIERELENINVSRTLNFVFRQMNQEFITLLHLVDVKLAFSNGYLESKRIVPLSQMESLLEEVIALEHQETVKNAILAQLQPILDYKDNPHMDFINQKQLSLVDSYWRVNKDKISKYEDFTVPGVILTATKNVMRTDGIIVEALLGQGDALDTYSHGLQDELVVSKQIANELQKAELKKQELALKIIETNNAEAAKVFSQVFPCCVNSDKKEDTNG